MNIVAMTRPPSTGDGKVVTESQLFLHNANRQLKQSISGYYT
jgi:hypothetical protein